MIKVRNLTKRYGSVVAVKNVSFSVARGEVLGFLGPNGAGKTTTMRIITCYMPPDEGSVTIADMDIFNQSREVRQRIGYLPESAPLYEDMGVIDYLSFIAAIRGISGMDRDVRIKHIVGVCGLEKVVSKQISHLSKGYRQRVGLAQAMIHDPDILILDEPTSGLDPHQIKEIRDLIKQIGEKKTIILCTHILQEVSMTCKRVIIINDGEIAASGTPEELTAKASGGSNARIGVRGDRTSVEKTLRGIERFSDIRFLDTDTEGFHRFMVTGQKDDDISVFLFQTAVEQGWVLNELVKSQATLEDVFLKLTEVEK